MSEDNIEDLQSEVPENEGSEISEEERLAKLTDDEPEEREPEKSDKEGAEKKDSTKEVKEEIKRLSEEDLDAIVTLKINGELKEMPVKEAIKLTQLEQASRAKMQEAANLKKQMDQVAAIAKQDPKQFFELLGVDPYEFAESTLAEKLELLEMSEEERRLKEAEEKLKKYEESEREREERLSRESEEREIVQAQEELDKEISEAWKESGLPMRKEFVVAIAQEMYGANIRKENLTASEAALRVKENWLGSLKNTISDMDAQAIHEMLGEEVIDKLRDFDVKRVTQKQRTSPIFNKSPGAKPASSTSKKSQPLTEDEYEAWKESLMNSL